MQYNQKHGEGSKVASALRRRDEAVAMPLNAWRMQMLRDAENELQRLIGGAVIMTPTREALDAFHRHLNNCERCRRSPINLCNLGAELLNLASRIALNKVKAEKSEGASA